MAEPVLEREGASLKLSGPITLNTVTRLLARGRAVLEQLPPAATLDLSGATRVDSAGVAMLVAFWRQRAQRGHHLAFTGIPDGLRPLLQMYDLESVFDPPGREPGVGS